MKDEAGKKHRIHIVICDDLAADRKRLYELVTDYIEEADIPASISVFRSGEELLASELGSVDLAFLDIYMDEMNGMETAKKLMSRNHRVQVIFTTTSPDFAAEAFSIDAFHYLLKPVEKEPLFKVLNRFMDGISAMRSITVKVSRVEDTVYLSDILYIEASGKKTIFHLKHGIREVSESLAEMKKRLEGEHFISPIRWALVPLGEVSSVGAGFLKLTDGTEIPISRGKGNEMKEAYADYRWDMMRNAMKKRSD